MPLYEISHSIFSEQVFYNVTLRKNLYFYFFNKINRKTKSKKRPLFKKSKIKQNILKTSNNFP